MSTLIKDRANGAGGELTGSQLTAQRAQYSAVPLPFADVPVHITSSS